MGRIIALFIFFFASFGSLFAGDQDVINYISKLKSTENIRLVEINTPKEPVYFFLNSVSRNKAIVLPVMVDKFLVVDLQDYKLSATVWDSLTKKEPYSSYPELSKLLNCEKPVIRSDWLLENFLSAPNYYKLLSVKNRKSFYSLTGYHSSATVEKGILTLSSISRYHRSIYRWPTISGGYLYSSTEGDQDLFKEVKSSLSLYLGSLPNKLQAYFISDNTGKALDYVDPKLMSHNGDLLKMALSCIQCHNEGVKSFKCSVRELIKDAKLVVKDVKKVEEFFLSDINENIEADKKLYLKAVFMATGMKPEELTDSLSRIIADYRKPLNKSDACKELGWTEAKYDKVVKSVLHPDALALTLLFNRKVSRAQWEELYLILRDYDASNH